MNITNYSKLGTLGLLGNLEPSKNQIKKMRKYASKIYSYNGSDENQIKEVIQKSTYIFACNTNLTPYVNLLTTTKLIVLAETGIANIDLNIAVQKKLNITNLPTYSCGAVVEFIVRCIMENLRPWNKVFSIDSHISRIEKIGEGIESKTIGIVGFGHIGQKVANVLLALGANVIFSTRTPKKNGDAKWTTLPQLFKKSDYIVVACSKNPDSIGLVDSTLLNKIKNGACIISISPQTIFNLLDLKTCIKNRKDLNFWLDFDQSPVFDELKKFNNVHISSHIAFYTKRSFINRVDESIVRLESFIKNRDWSLDLKSTVARKNVYNLTDESGQFQETPQETILSVASRFYQSAALFAAFELGIFDVMGQRAIKISDIVVKINCNKDLMIGLLNALVSSNIVNISHNGKYYIKNSLAPVLLKSSKDYFGDTVLALKNNVYKPWYLLADSIKNRRSTFLIHHSRETDELAAAACTNGSDSQSRSVVKYLLPYIPKLEDLKIIDVGCGSAVITRSLLRILPKAKATIIDVSNVIFYVKNKYFKQKKLLNRCTFIAGDYRLCYPKVKADLVIMSNIIHMESVKINMDLLKNAYLNLNNEGMIMIVGFFPERRPENDFLVSHFSLSCQLLTKNGRCYYEDEVNLWLNEIGYSDIKFKFITKYVSIITAKKYIYLNPA